MALLFNADGDRVDYTGASLIDIGSVGTMLVWLYPTDDTARQGIAGAANADMQLNFNGHQAGDPWVFIRQRSTTYLQANAPSANFASYGLNKWICLATAWDGATAPILAMGDLSTLLAEPSAYTTQTVGSGTYLTGNSFRVGMPHFSTTLEFKGRIAFVAVWDRRLTLAELQSQQFRPRVSDNCVLFTHLGFNGLGNQIDWSGKGYHGTLTGTTLASHVPIKIF